MSPSRTKWTQYLIAVLLGNAIYYILFPRLPLAARHHAFRVDLGTVIDFWLCLLVYGLTELGIALARRISRR